MDGAHECTGCIYCRPHLSTDSVASGTPRPGATVPAELPQDGVDTLPGRETRPLVDAAPPSPATPAASLDRDRDRSREVTTPPQHDEQHDPLDPHAWHPESLWHPGPLMVLPPPVEPDGIRITPGPGRGVTVELDRDHAVVLGQMVAHYSGLTRLDGAHVAPVAGWVRETWQRVLVDVLLAATSTAAPDEVVHVPIRDFTSARTAPQHTPDSPSAEEPRP